MLNYYLKRFDEDEFKKTSIDEFGFFLGFAECGNWEPDVEKDYEPRGGYSNFTLIDKEEVERIVKSVKDSLVKIIFNQSLINYWDDDETIKRKEDYLKHAKTDYWKKYLNEMVAYLREHKEISFGLYVYCG